MPARKVALQVVWFFLGLLIAAIGGSLIIKAGLGAAPWDIFHLGASQRTGIALGAVIQGAGVFIILLNMLLGIRPSMGMILNMLTYGPMLQYTLPFVSQPLTLPGRWLMLAVGVVVFGQGIALYTSADLGAGPRDGMMIGLTRKLGLPVAIIKNGIDVLVALLGWWLGGPLGVGTVVIALTQGPAIQFGMATVRRLANHAPFNQFVKPVSLHRS